MSDLKSRSSGRRQGSLLSTGELRPRVGGQGSSGSAASSSLLGQAVARERARQAHREAAERRKPAAPAAKAAEPMDPGELEKLFAGWDAPAVAPKGTAAAAAPPERIAIPADPPGDEVWRPLIDPMALVNGVIRSKTIIAGTTLLGALAGVVIALSTPKHYVSWAELLVDPRNLQIVDRDLTGNGWLPSEATLSLIENQVRIMRSGPVMETVVDKLNLDSDPEFNGSGKALGIGGVLTSLHALLAPSDGPTSGELRRAIAVENVAEAISIERTGKTFVIEISAKTRDPQKSALVANTLIDVYMAKSADLQSENAGRASGELGGRLETLRKEVGDAERRIEEYKATHDLIDAKGGLIGDDELIRLNDQLTAARARTLELNSRAASVRSLGVDAVINGGLPEQVSNGAMAQLRVQYSALAQEVAKAVVRLGPRHPERLALEAQLADARRGIDSELHRIVTSIQVELKRAVEFEQDLAARLAQLKARWATVSDRLIELREIERDAAAKRTVYESFLLRARETGEQESINTGNISVVSRAAPPLDPTGTSRAVTAILGTVLGFMAGIGIGMLRGAWAGLRRNASIPPRPPGRTAPASRPIPPSGDGVRVARSAEPPAGPPPMVAEPQAAPAAPAMAPAQPWIAPAAAGHPFASQPHFVVWPQPATYVPQPMMSPVPVWMQPQPAAIWSTPAMPQPLPVQPAPPEPAAAQPATDRRMETLRRGLSDFRAAVEDLAAARGRRRR